MLEGASFSPWSAVSSSPLHLVLPVELIQWHVFTSLGVVDHLLARQVCRYWRDLLEQEHLWKHYCQHGDEHCCLGEDEVGPLGGWKSHVVSCFYLESHASSFMFSTHAVLGSGVLAHSTFIPLLLCTSLLEFEACIAPSAVRSSWKSADNVLWRERVSRLSRSSPTMSHAERACLIGDAICELMDAITPEGYFKSTAVMEVTSALISTSNGMGKIYASILDSFRGYCESVIPWDPASCTSSTSPSHLTFTHSLGGLSPDEFILYSVLAGALLNLEMKVRWTAVTLSFRGLRPRWRLSIQRISNVGFPMQETPSSSMTLWTGRHFATSQGIRVTSSIPTPVWLPKNMFSTLFVPGLSTPNAEDATTTRRVYQLANATLALERTFKRNDVVDAWHSKRDMWRRRLAVESTVVTLDVVKGCIGELLEHMRPTPSCEWRVFADRLCDIRTIDELSGLLGDVSSAHTSPVPIGCIGDEEATPSLVKAVLRLETALPWRAVDEEWRTLRPSWRRLLLDLGSSMGVRVLGRSIATLMGHMLPKPGTHWERHRDRAQDVSTRTQLEQILHDIMMDWRAVPPPPST